MSDDSSTTLIEYLQPPRGVVAIAMLNGDSTQIACPQRFRERYFEAGSLTKTFTATVLATLVTDGTIELHTEVGAILGEGAGAAAHVRMVELATHTSGLPRLAPNAITFPFWPRDPYRFYGMKQLVKGLRSLELGERGKVAYSNLGYSLLGACLERVTGSALADLLNHRVFKPLGITNARCQPCPRRGLLRGHGPLLIGGRRWHDRLPGAGGVDCTIDDLALWAAANMRPESTPLEDAIRLAQTAHELADGSQVGLAWQFNGSALWHNGATGQFQAALVIQPGRNAIAALATHAPSKTYMVDRRILEWTTQTKI